MSFRQDVRVLNGLPLIALYLIDPAEPDVGIMSPYPGDITLHDRDGRRARWAEDRMEADDWEALQTYIMENHDA